jgi:hypothetical protein
MKKSDLQIFLAEKRKKEELAIIASHRKTIFTGGYDEDKENHGLVSYNEGLIL